MITEKERISMLKLKKFPKRNLQTRKESNSYYKGGNTSHQRRVKTAKELSGNCWWIETFLRMYPNVMKK